MRIILPLLQFEVLVYDVVDVERFVGNALIKIRYHFEAETLDEAHHRLGVWVLEVMIST